MKYLIQDFKIRRYNKYSLIKCVYWFILDCFDLLRVNYIYSLLCYIENKLYKPKAKEYGLKDSNYYDDIGYICNSMSMSYRTPISYFYAHECAEPMHQFYFKSITITFLDKKFERITFKNLSK